MAVPCKILPELSLFQISYPLNIHPVSVISIDAVWPDMQPRGIEQGIGDTASKRRVEDEDSDSSVTEHILRRGWQRENEKETKLEVALPASAGAGHTVSDVPRHEQSKALDKPENIENASPTGVSYRLAAAVPGSQQHKDQCIDIISRHMWEKSFK